MTRRTIFTVSLSGAGVAQATSVARVATVSAHVNSRMRASRGNVGKFSVYALADSARMRATVAPDHAGDCLRLESQIRRGGRWRLLHESACFRLSSKSRADLRLRGSRDYLGHPVRIRAQWRGDVANTATKSLWRYVKFVR